VCGIAGSSVPNGVLEVQSFADGSSWAEIHFTFIFTAAATGKSIQISGSDRNGGTVIPPPRAAPEHRGSEPLL
jgi:hypothetical protein